MNTTQTLRKSILDPSFRYVPALETDVAATWRRFGFDPRRNAERRAGRRRDAQAPVLVTRQAGF
jgi:hypothetical protein